MCSYLYIRIKLGGRSVAKVGWGYVMGALLILSVGCTSKATDEEKKDNHLSEPITLTWYTRGDAQRLNHLKGLKELQDRMGICIEFIADEENADDLYHLMLASGSLPDIITWKYSSYPSRGGVGELYRDGISIELTDLIEEYAPNLKEIYETRPDIKKEVATSLGEIIYFPSINPMETEEQRLRKSYSGIVIREDWLETLGLEMPQSIEGWYQVLTSFKTGDPNHNGIEDEIPFVSNGIDCFMPSFGILGNICIDQEGKVVYGPIEPEYKAFLETMSLWYEEGLVDQEIFSASEAWMDEKIIGNVAGSFKGLDNAWSKYLVNLQERSKYANFEAVPWPISTSGNRYTYRAEMATHIDETQTVITKDCKYPEEAVKLIDYMYSQEGTLLTNWGIEGETYKVEDGKPILMEEAKKKQDTGRILLYEYAMGYMGLPRFGGDEVKVQLYTGEQLEANRIWGECNTSLIYPPTIMMSNEERSLITNYMNDIDTYMKDMKIRFITGIEPTSNFDSYVENIKKMGIDKVIALYNKHYEQYRK